MDIRKKDREEDNKKAMNNHHKAGKKKIYMLLFGIKRILLILCHVRDLIAYLWFALLQ